MTIKEVLSKAEDFVHKYWYIAVIPFMTWGFILTMVEKEDIEIHQTETVGKVIGSTTIVKHPSKRSYHYEFYIEGKKYTGSSTAYLSKDVNEGEFYRIEYSYEKPEHNRMNFDYQYFMKIIKDSNGVAIDSVFKEL